METFEEIYQTNFWEGEESLSGPGSGHFATHRLPWELMLFKDQWDKKDQPQSFLNVACGDDFWTPWLPGYIGVDVAPTAIARAKERHPNRTYIELDAVREELPTCDVVIVRDCIQHLPLEDGLALLENIRKSGTKWMIVSTFVDGVNEDIEVGDAYRNNLCEAPFNEGEPLKWIPDGYSTTELEMIPTRDKGKFLGIWSMP